METVTHCFLGLQNHCRQWLHPWNQKILAPWKKSYDKSDRALKSRDITLLSKVCIVKAIFFSPVVMYGCESWTRKKTELWRFDAFKLWCWRRLLRVPLTARRSNQSVLKEINPEGLMPKLQYFGYLMQRADSSEITLSLGKIEGRIRHDLSTKQEQTLESFLKGDSIFFVGSLLWFGELDVDIGEQCCWGWPEIPISSAPFFFDRKNFPKLLWDTAQFHHFPPSLSAPNPLYIGLLVSHCQPRFRGGQWGKGFWEHEVPWPCLWEAGLAFYFCIDGLGNQVSTCF